MDLSTSQAKELLDDLPFDTENQKYAFQQKIRRAEADDLRMGTKMLETSAQILTDQHDNFSNECIAVADGLEAVAAMAARPDSDYKATLKAYQDLVARARVLAVIRDQWGERVTEFNERIGDPAAHAEALRVKWAERSLTNRSLFLHQFPNVR